MADSKMPNFEISVARMEPAEGAPTGHPKGLMVTFAIRRPNGWPSFEFPVFVSTEHFDEAELIKVARHYLHKTAEALGSQTADWAKSQSWLEEHHLIRKKGP